MAEDYEKYDGAILHERNYAVGLAACGMHALRQLRTVTGG
jgi:hypothetical protein